MGRLAIVQQPPRRSAEWSKTTFLGRLSAATRTHLLSLGTTRTYANGEVVLEHGASTDHVVVVLSGAVKVIAYTEHGEAALLAIRIRGDLVGEQAGMDGKPRSASVIACGEVLVRSVRLDDMKSFLRREHEAHDEMRRMVSERWRSSDQLRVDFFGSNARSRLARVLIEVAKMGGWDSEERWPLNIPLTRAELGSLASMPLSTAEKQARQLTNEGLVATDQGRITLLDTAKLRAIADSG
jgi:CRP/FNR family transcriptional regulator, cyclic AMP receptor protein